MNDTNEFLRSLWAMNHLNVDLQTQVALKFDERDKRIRELEAAAKDSRYLVAALIKAAGGRVELSQTVVMSICSRDQITTWDDPISGKKVYVLETSSKQPDQYAAHTQDCAIRRLPSRFGEYVCDCPASKIKGVE